MEISKSADGKSKKKSNITEILDGDNLLTDNADIVNKLADFFSNIGQTLNYLLTQMYPLFIM